MRIALLLVACAALPASAQPATDIKSLHAGVSGIGFPGLPGPVCVFGPDAFTVVAVPSKAGADPVVAAGRLGKGRVVAFGHNGYLGADNLKAADTRKFLGNVVRWAGRGDGPKVVTVGNAALAKALTDDGFTVTDVPGAKWVEKAVAAGVVIVDAARITKDDAAALRKYVEAGGGVISGVPGWGWLQLNAGKTLDADFPANHLFAAAGIAWAEGTLERPKDGVVPVAGSPPPLTHTGFAIDALDRWAGGGPALSAADADLVRGAVTRLNGSVPTADAAPLREKLAKALATAGEKMPVPTKQKAVGPKDPSGKLLLSIYTQHAMRLPPDQTKAHPAAATFPGSVPADAPRVTKTVTVELGTPGYKCDGYGAGAGARLWHSTGLYAAPGEAIRVTVPAGTTAKGLGVQIGSHTDTLWHLQSWQRTPEVTRRFPLAAGETVATANSFGGLVYVTFPHDAPRATVEVTIAGAVEAPFFVLGKTTPEEWAAARKHAAPWAEFASGKLVITIPSDAARKVDDPAEVMKFWDTALDACADLSAVPRERGRAERFVHDVQISAGYMHSGYPIMAPLGEIPTCLDPAKVKRDGVWGYFHELGHNHQGRDWTFDGTVEVTCNLYSLYLTETLCPKAPLHGEMQPASITRNAAKYRAGGSQFDTWKREPFVALILYKQIRDEFGWEPFKKAFAEYQKLAPGERPKSDADRRDQWLTRMSAATGKNLAPAFEFWGVPVTAAAKEKAGKLPAWTPPDPAGMPKVKSQR